jgi:RNA recognition motif-containing protein
MWEEEGGKRRKSGQTKPVNSAASFDLRFRARVRAAMQSRAKLDFTFLRTTTMAGTPNNTLYINNLNDKVNKNELRHQLFSLFMTYGRVIDVVAQKGPKMRGQAFLVFSDLAEATAAMRACEGFLFYDKPMVRSYSTFYACVQNSPVFAFSTSNTRRRNRTLRYGKKTQTLYRLTPWRLISSRNLTQP